MMRTTAPVFSTKAIRNLQPMEAQSRRTVFRTPAHATALPTVEPATDVVHHDAAIQQMSSIGRRRLLSSTAACIAISWSQAALAEETIRNGLLASAPGLLNMAARSAALPPAVRFPRRSLNQRFAVLLMQSCYRAADALNFIPMDKFQVAFWKLRQKLYSDYLDLYAPLQVPQGDLTNPLYFDFIAFVQFATICQEMPRGQQEFEEFCEDSEACPSRYRTVTRAAGLADNSLLPAAFQRQAGDNIYRNLRDGFGGPTQEVEQFGAPPAAATGASFEQLVGGVQAILDIFLARGFATKAVVTDVQAAVDDVTSGSFTVRLDAPANLWGTAALLGRKAAMVNAYDAMAIDGYLRASGRQPTYTFSRSDTGSETHWSL